MDIAIVDALARLQLEARRAGLCVTVREAPRELTVLIGLCGLEETLGVEPRRETEQREERFGVQEEAELDDPAV
jgi:hypothetical protein